MNLKYSLWLSSNLKVKYYWYQFIQCFLLTFLLLMLLLVYLKIYFIGFQNPIQPLSAVGPTAKCWRICIFSFYLNRNLTLFSPRIYPTKNLKFSNFPSSWDGNVTHGKLHVSRSLLEGARKIWFSWCGCSFLFAVGNTNGMAGAAEASWYMWKRPCESQYLSLVILVPLNQCRKQPLPPGFLLHQKWNANKPILNFFIYKLPFGLIFCYSRPNVTPAW